MKTKYPILMVHGIIIKNVLFFNSFGKIPKELKKAGFNVYTSTNDGVGSIESNASQIKKQIEEIIIQENVEKVNIIAHSKGGLDSKYMITNLNMADKVASLTTIGTPHKGSQIATKILKLPKFILIVLSKSINIIYKILGDKKPNVLKACNELKTKENIKDISNEITNKVYFQSYSTTLEKSSDDLLMSIPYKFSKKYENDKSDGLVSKTSSEFGEYKGDCLNDSISHTEIIDIMTTKKEKKEIYNFYKKLCNDLTKKGF